MEPTPLAETADSRLRHYVQVLRRGWWIVVPSLLLVTAGVLVATLRQERLYEASSSVLISRATVAGVVAGTETGGQVQDFPRILQTRADVAHSTPVAAMTLAAAGLSGRTPASFLERSTAEPEPQSDLLKLSVRDPDPQVAKRLSQAFANQFSAYEQRLEAATVRAAREAVERRLDEAPPDSRLAQALRARIERLAEVEALTTSGGQPIEYPTKATQVQPQPLRNGVVGGGIGLLLGVGLVFLFDALDSRLRSSDDIGTILGLPLLARIPSPPRELARDGKPVLLEDPHAASAEAYRMLALSVEFGTPQSNSTVLGVTSALEGEGKSTTVANLGLALAEAGWSVVIVDLDLRRPTIARFFGLEDSPGISDLLAGRTGIDEVAQPIARGQTGQDEEPASDQQEIRGSLRVITAGSATAEPSYLLRHPRLTEALQQLAGVNDFVLLDAPPLLRVSDPGSIADLAHGLVVVTRLGIVRRPMLREVQRLLQRYPAEKLGFVLTNAEQEESEYYDASYLYRGDYASNTAANGGRRSLLRRLAKG